MKNEYASYELYPVRSGSLTEMEYTPQATSFSLWAPTADEVRLMLYEEGQGGHAYRTVSMEAGEEGVWHAIVDEDLMGRFYTFNVKIGDRWLGDTPGINARAVLRKIQQYAKPEHCYFSSVETSGLLFRDGAVTLAETHPLAWDSPDYEWKYVYEGVDISTVPDYSKP